MQILSPTVQNGQSWGRGIHTELLSANTRLQGSHCVVT